MPEEIEVDGRAQEPEGGLRVAVIFPSSDDESDDHSRIEHILATELALFEKQWTTPGPPPWAGSSFEAVYWVGNMVAGGVTWDLIKKLASAMAAAAAQCRELELAARFDLEALKLVALAHARELEPQLASEMQLVAAIGDSEVDATSWDAGPGAYLFRIPCLATRSTLIVELDSFGTVLASGRREYLPNDALAC